MRSLRVLAASFLLVSGGFFGGLAIHQTSLGRSVGMAPPRVMVDETPIQRDGRLSPSFAPIVERAAPSVVYISTTRTVRARSVPPLFDDPFFQRFFGDRFSRDQEPREHQQRGLGSGVIVSENGYILTSNHVIEGADEILVTLVSTRREYPAAVVGTDAGTDVAVLKIDVDNLPAVTMTDSDQIRVGDIVLAIGNPFALGQTVTKGIVSATSRGVQLMNYEDFIQTDAAINVGNSGGALIDVEGRLVGINTAILSQSGGNHGIGFAVPINLARMVMDRLITDGRVVRGFLGVRPQPVTDDLARAFKLENLDGALVGEVTPGGPAAKAGIQAGDVIVELDGRKITDHRTLRLRVAQTRPGTTVPVTLVRDGEQRKIEVVLEELKLEETAQRSFREPEAPASLGVLEGVEVADITARSRQQFEIPQGIRGALVTGVRPDSEAFRQGLRPGDVVLDINRREIAGADDAISVVSGAEGDRLLLRVWSRDLRGSRYLSIPVAPR